MAYSTSSCSGGDHNYAMFLQCLLLCQRILLHVHYEHIFEVSEVAFLRKYMYDLESRLRGKEREEVNQSRQVVFKEKDMHLRYSENDRSASEDLKANLYLKDHCRPLTSLNVYCLARINQLD